MTFDEGREPRTLSHIRRFTKDKISKTEKKEDKVRRGSAVLRGYAPSCPRRDICLSLTLKIKVGEDIISIKVKVSQRQTETSKG